LNRRGEGLSGKGFSETGESFKQDMAIGEEADDHAIDHPALAEDNAAHFIAQD
jgi:hypothetical protein